MSCAWEDYLSEGLGVETPYANWQRVLRPDHLRDLWPFLINKGDLSLPISAGTIELPLFRPVYVRVLGDDDSQIRENARKCLEVAAAAPFSVLLGQDARNALARLAAASDPIPDHWRYLFVHVSEHLLDVTMRSVGRFPLSGHAEPLLIGPGVPGLSIRNLLTGRAPRVPAVAARPAMGDVAGLPVVTAVIDADIGIANARFRNCHGKTRVAHFWRQSRETLDRMPALTVGRAFDSDQIDEMLADSHGDEALFYRLLRSGRYGTANFSDAEFPIIVAGAEHAPDVNMPLLTSTFLTRLTYFVATGGPIIFQSAKDQTAPRVINESLEHLLGDDILDAWSARSDGSPVNANILKKLIELGGAIDVRRAPTYAAAGRSRAAGFRAGHGTHILDLAAGYPPEEAPVDRPIVAVELPDYVVEDTSGSRLDVFCLMAMRQILNWVDDWQGAGKAVPVVVNVSLANAAGPKDGTGFLEAELKRLAEARDLRVPTKLVLSAGNGYRARLDASFTTHDEETIEWRVPPGDKSASYLEIRANPVKDLKLTVKAPGVPATELSVSDLKQLKCKGKTVGQLYRTEEGDHTVLTLALAPTLALDPPRLQAPAGTYRLTFANTGSGSLRVELGVQRDDTLSAYPRYGRQSYLDHPGMDQRDRITGAHDAPRRDCPIMRERTLSAYATADSGVCYAVGGAYAGTGAPSRYTASGPTAARAAPDLATVSEDGPGAPGRLAAGYFSGSAVMYRGASTAAAEVTRALVDQLAGRAGRNISKDEFLKSVLPERADRADLRLGMGVMPAASPRGRNRRPLG